MQSELSPGIRGKSQNTIQNQPAGGATDSLSCLWFTQPFERGWRSLREHHGSETQACILYLCQRVQGGSRLSISHEAKDTELLRSKVEREPATTHWSWRAAWNDSGEYRMIQYWKNIYIRCENWLSCGQGQTCTTQRSIKHHITAAELV